MFEYSFANYIVCHFGSTYINGRTGEPSPPLFLFQMFKGDLTMKACARFDEILVAGYFSNGLSILGVNFVNLAPIRRHLYGQNDFFFGFPKGI